MKHSCCILLKGLGIECIENEILSYEVSNSSAIKEINFIPKKDLLIIIFLSKNSAGDNNVATYQISQHGGEAFYKRFINSQSKGKFYGEYIRLKSKSKAK
jgi:hypothetical protein